MTAFHPRIAWAPSPNQYSRDGADVEAVVFHFTRGGGAKGSIRWLCNPDAGGSAHFVIARDGATTQLVPLSEASWHAGTSRIDQYGNVNRRTIGIELANHGKLELIDGEFFYPLGRSLRRYKREEPQHGMLHLDEFMVEGWWEPFPNTQIDALQELLLDLSKCGPYKQAVMNRYGHDEIARPVGRKIDPGPLFPWERFRKVKSDEP